MDRIQGNELFQLLVELAGLEDPRIENDLLNLMQKLKIDPMTLSTDEMRVLMAAYLNEFQEKYVDKSPMIPDALLGSSQKAEA